MALFIIFLAEFLFSLHFAATLYINSSFLEHFFSLRAIGALYVLGAIGNTILFLLAPKFLSWLGIRRFLFFFLTITLGATVAAAYVRAPLDAAIFFLIYASVSMMVYYALDLLLEERSVNKKTGEIRGIYLTIANTAIALGPVLIAIFNTEEKFKVFYLAAAAVLLPLFAISLLFLKSRFPRRKYSGHSLPFVKWWRNKNVRRVTFARLALEFFYAFAAIYVPIYLHSYIGFNWTEIGLIFVIMLLPFIIFEWPAGELADRYFGEKEIMSAGFFITLASMLLLPGLGKVFFSWAVILFISRIGASFIEITTESYFFKQISSKDSGLISIFRLARSGGLILGAGIGALAVTLWPFNSIFYILAAVCFLGFLEGRKLVDTK